MGSSKRLAAHYDMRAQPRAIVAAARAGPLQSLADRELGLRELRESSAGSARGLATSRAIKYTPSGSISGRPSTAYRNRT